MRAALCLLAVLGLAVSAAAAADDPVARGDAAWARRAEGHRGGRAAPGPVAEAIAAYEQAVQARPDDLAAAWKLLRALHFQGEHVAATREAKRDVFGRGRDVAEAALDRLARRLGGRDQLDRMTPEQAAKALAGVPEALPVHVWAGVHWGLWGDAFGRLAAARQGVGDRIRRYGEVGLALDERFDAAAPLRLLGRLHTLAPKVPFVTGWVDRGKAVTYLRRAVALAPGHPLNHLYLAEALLEHQPDRKSEALAILRRLVTQPPAPDRLVEDEKAIADARALLAKHQG